MTLLARLQGRIDKQDCLFFGGLLLLSSGLGMVALPLGLIAAGGLLFLVSVGAFMPRGGKV